MGQRLLGSILFAVGVLMTYLCVIDPLLAANRQAESVSLSLKGAILCPFALVYGMFYIVLGEHSETLLGTREKPSVMAWVLIFVLAGLGFLLYFWIKSIVESRGYRF